MLCVNPWSPTWVNNGHECVVCELSTTADPGVFPLDAPWNLNDRHVAQRNFQVIAAGSFQLQLPCGPWSGQLLLSTGKNPTGFRGSVSSYTLIDQPRSKGHQECYQLLPFRPTSQLPLPRRITRRPHEKH